MTSHTMPTTPRAKSGKILRTLLLCATAVSWLSAPAAAQKSINRLAQLSGSDFRVALSLSPTVPIQGQPVSFTGATTGDVRFWLWDFGDGWTSTRQNEVHTYRKSGFYKVSLTATGPTGTKKTLRTFAVMPETLAASFVFSPTSPGIGQTVSFADTTPGDPTAWAWDFGDGATSTSKNPTHAYAKAGSYAVTLSATASSGMKRASRSLTVATMSILASSFSYTPAAPTAGQSIQFTDTSSGNPTAWLWVFGDGLKSTAHNPIHVFSAPGSYSVMLTTANSSGSKTIKPDRRRGGRPRCVLLLRTGLPVHGPIRAVHGHFDGQSNGLVLELRRRRDQYIPQSLPCLLECRVLQRQPHSQRRFGVEDLHQGGRCGSRPDRIIHFQPKLSGCGPDCAVLRSLDRQPVVLAVELQRRGHKR